MIPLKWKIYRIMNYVLLMAAAFVFFRFFQLLIRDRYLAPKTNPYQVVALFTSLVFLLMVLQSIINLIIMAKNFPDKILTGARNRWHILATIINGILLVIMIYACFSFMSEMAAYPEGSGVIIFFLIIVFITLSTLFVFICQLTLKKYLRRNNRSLVKSMIDSIGTDV